MVKELVVAVPELHPGLCPDREKEACLSSLCPGMRWLCPGLPPDVLPVPALDSSYRPTEGAWLTADWPLAPAEVRAWLAEIARWTESGLTGSEMRSACLLARTDRAKRDECRTVRDTVYSLTDSDIPAGSEDELERARCEAQRVLLLAWSQEERLMEIRRLAARCRQAAERLRDALHAEPGESGNSFELLVVPEENEADRPDWRPVMERMALFLPVDAVLCTEDARLIRALHEVDLCRKSLADAGLDCPGVLKAVAGRLLGERLPMWRILGYTQTQAGKPWLDVVRPMLVVMSSGVDDNA